MGGLLLVLGCCALARPPARAAIINRTLRGEPTTQLTIALGGFAPAYVQEVDLGTLGAAVLTADLRFTTVFDVMDPTQLPFAPPTVQLSTVQTTFPGLSALKVQYLALGTVAPRGPEVLLDARLYDVATGMQVFGRRYVGDPQYFRGLVHRFADDILFHLTGDHGVAETRIAYVRAISRTEKELYVMDYDGARPVPITANHSINVSPRWSPDGTALAYTSYEAGNPDIYLWHLDSGRRTLLSAVHGLNASPGWAPDGQTLALARTAGEGTALCLVPATGGPAQALTHGSAINVSPSFSPTGQELAFTSDRGGTPQLYLMDRDGTDVRRLTFQGRYNTSPRWSPRGDRIAFTCRTAGKQICLISPEGTDLQQLTIAGSNEDPAWAPDGRHLVFTSNRTGHRALFVMQANGSEQQLLAADPDAEYLPDWSPIER